MEKIKEFIQNHLVDIVISASVLFFVFGVWLLYTVSRTEHEYQHVNKSVADVEAGIDRAESGARTAQTEIEDAKKHVKRANETTGKLTERTKRNQAELDECERITDRMQERAGKIESIIRDVEAGNKGTRTQADSTAETAGCVGGSVHDSIGVHTVP